MRADQTPAWQALHVQAQALAAMDLCEAFAQDPQRVQGLSLSAPHVWADLSKNHVDRATEALLRDLAEQTGLGAQRQALFEGAPINSSEGRAALHWLARVPAGAELPAGLHTAHQQVLAERQAMLALAEAVRADARITDVVHIGIGGSDLGPQMAVQALQPLALPGKRFHFVANVDGHELAQVLAGLQAASTLFVIASKTFTTLETLNNAHSARTWLAAQGVGDVAQQLVGITAHPAAAQAWGVGRVLAFGDAVGGRCSLWSAIGLPLAIAIGAAGFEALLAGAHAMDRHFQTAPLAQNLPVRLGLLDLWYRNFRGQHSRCVAPYHSGLRRWPAYLQQLEMESNGKRVDRHGQALPFATAPVVWGEPGTNGQHAFFQLLHQGSEAVPVEFVAVKTPTHGLEGHHRWLLANALAQAQALLQGQPDGPAHRQCPGNRPSTFLLLDDLSPSSLGALVALHEHRVFVSGAVWGLNSFDQWGVELGKTLARDLHARLHSGDVQGLDASTAALLQRLR